MLTDTMGVYGNHYLKRAWVAKIGLGALPVVDAIYPMNLADADGKPFDGVHDYVIHFAQAEAGRRLRGAISAPPRASPNRRESSHRFASATDASDPMTDHALLRAAGDQRERKYVDTGNFAADHADELSVELLLNHGPYSLLAGVSTPRTSTASRRTRATRSPTRSGASATWAGSPSPTATTTPTTGRRALLAAQAVASVLARRDHCLYRFQPGERRPGVDAGAASVCRRQVHGRQPEHHWRYYNWTRYELRETQNRDTGDWSTVHRLRNQVRIEIPLAAKDRTWTPKSWYLLADVEPIYRSDSGQIDPLRLRAGLGYIANPRLLVEFQYYNQFTRPNGGSLEYTDNIIRLNFKILTKDGLLSGLGGDLD